MASHSPRPESAAAWPTPMTMAYGEALVRSGLIPASALEAACRDAVERGIPLHEAVISSGLVNERPAYMALAEIAGMPFVDFDSVVQSPLARRLVPSAVLRRHTVLPVGVDDRAVTYLTSTPYDSEAGRAVSMASGRAASALMTCGSSLRAAVAGEPGESRATGAALNADVRAAGGSRRPTVLIVDDDATTRLLVRLLLERDGWDVRQAQNGRDALEAAARHDPDVIVMDLLMPELDGYGAILALRGQPRHLDTPIVVVTTEEGPLVERRVIALGADDYILKPFEPTVLTSRVKAALRRRWLAA